jgi:hypothetical protein
VSRFVTRTDYENAHQDAKDGRLDLLVSRVVALALAVANAEPADIEATARGLGGTRRYLAPIAWAAGALVLLVRGVKLLVLNWRLTLVELVPAAWLWIVMWELKDHALRDVPFRHLTVQLLVAIGVLAITASIASFWCNTVFALAITGPQPRIAPAVRQTRPYRGTLVLAGVLLGALLTAAVVVIPRLGARWLFACAIGALYAIMLTSFVVVPARAIGLKRQKLPPRQAIGRIGVGSALSAIAMTPGFLLDRLGLVLLGLSGLHVLGFVLLSIGTALYAAGMSSVRAVKLTMKLETAPL